MHTIESWVNPFKSRNATEPLVNIASAVKATDSITHDLRIAEQKGNAAFVSFVEKRLKSNEIDYLYAPLPNPICRRSEIESSQRQLNQLQLLSSSRLIEVGSLGWSS